MTYDKVLLEMVLPKKSPVAWWVLETLMKIMRLQMLRGREQSTILTKIVHS
jgi:hypothetical protein